MSRYPPPRSARAAVFTTVCVSLTLFGHDLAGQGVVQPAALALGGAMVLGLAWVLAGHQRSLATIFGGLLGGQFGMHVLFAICLSGPEHAAYGAAHAAHAHTLTGADTASGPTMSLAHVVIAAVSAWWLWHGERLAWRLARRVAALAAVPLRWLFALLLPLPADAPHGVSIPAAPPVRPVGALLRHSVVLRGPPPSRSLRLSVR
jgi:hypothetical protein